MGIFFPPEWCNWGCRLYAKKYGVLISVTYIMFVLFSQAECTRTVAAGDGKGNHKRKVAVAGILLCIIEMLMPFVSGVY